MHHGRVFHGDYHFAIYKFIKLYKMIFHSSFYDEFIYRQQLNWLIFGGYVMDHYIRYA